MSSKSTIFLTTANEHCYSDCVEYSRSGENSDVFLEIDNDATTIDFVGETWRIRLHDEIKKIIGISIIMILNKDIKGFHFDPYDGWQIHIDGDSKMADFLRNLKVDKKYR